MHGFVFHRKLRVFTEFVVHLNQVDIFLVIQGCIISATHEDNLHLL